MSAQLNRQQSSDIVTLYISLIPFLKEHSPISVSETARYFNVPTDVIVRAVNDLYYMGPFDKNGVIPGGGMFEFDMDLFDEGRGEILLSQNPTFEHSPRLSGREAIAILAGLQILNAAAPADSRDVITALTEKIRLGKPSDIADLAIRPATPPEAVVASIESIAENKQISIVYASPDGSQQPRVIDPIRVEYSGSDWFIRAWCHLRHASRLFRADRIVSFSRLESERETNLLETVELESMFDESETDFTAVLEVPPWVKPLISDYEPTFIGTADNNNVLLAIRFAKVSSAIRLVSRFPGFIQLVEPLEVREAIAQWAISPR